MVKVIEIEDEAYNDFEIMINGKLIEITIKDAEQLQTQLSQLLQDREVG